MAFTGSKGSLVTADPTYEQAWRTSQRAGAKLIKVPQRKDYSHDVEAMCAADPSTGMLYICNPNNPDRRHHDAQGHRVRGEEHAEGAPLSSMRPTSTSPIPRRAPSTWSAGGDVVVPRTFSKLYGMAGLRLGFRWRAQLNLSKMNGGSGRSQGIIAATTIGAGVASLSDPDLIPARKALIKKQRTETIAWLEKKAILARFRKPTTFRSTSSGRDASSRQIWRLGVNVGRTWPGFETWSRVSASAPKPRWRGSVRPSLRSPPASSARFAQERTRKASLETPANSPSCGLPG